MIYSLPKRFKLLQAKQESLKAGAKAKYTSSFGGMTKAFLGELPSATKQVFSAPFKAAKVTGGVIGAALSKNVNFDNSDKNELRFRAENLRKIRDASQKYQESHPGFKVPREMR
jgi:hypothetical protein